MIIVSSRSFVGKNLSDRNSMLDDIKCLLVPTKFGEAYRQVMERVRKVLVENGRSFVGESLQSTDCGYQGLLFKLPWTPLIEHRNNTGDTYMICA